MKKLLAILALVCCFGVAIQGQDIEKARAAQQALAALELAPATRDAAGRVPRHHVRRAAGGARRREAGRRDPRQGRPRHLLQRPDADEEGRPSHAAARRRRCGSAARARPAHGGRARRLRRSDGHDPATPERVRDQDRPGASNWRLVAVRVTSPGPDGTCVGLGDATPMPSTVEALPHDITFESLLCDGGDNAKRGVSLNGNALTLIYSVVKGIRQPTLNNDTQASLLQRRRAVHDRRQLPVRRRRDGPVRRQRPEDREPRAVEHRDPRQRDHEGSGVEGHAQPGQEPARAEERAARHDRAEPLEYSWADAQDGTAVLFTIRNQEGGCPWCTVEDVDWGFNIVAHAANGLSILGHDDCGPNKDCSGSPPRPSGRVTNIRIHDSLWYDLGTGPYSKVGDSTFGWSINDGVVGFTVERNTMIGKYSTLLKLSPGRTKTASVGLAFRNNVLSEGKYAVIADGLAAGPRVLGAGGNRRDERLREQPAGANGGRQLQVRRRQREVWTGRSGGGRGVRAAAEVRARRARV
jgi:hypothetical protein